MGFPELPLKQVHLFLTGTSKTRLKKLILFLSTYSLNIVFSFFVTFSHLALFKLHSFSYPAALCPHTPKSQVWKYKGLKRSVHWGFSAVNLFVWGASPNSYSRLHCLLETQPLPLHPKGLEPGFFHVGCFIACHHQASSEETDSET